MKIEIDDRPTIVFHEVPVEYKRLFNVKPDFHPVWTGNGLSFTARLEVDMKGLLNELIKPKRKVNVIRYLHLLGGSKSFRKTRKYARILGRKVERRRQ